MYILFEGIDGCGKSTQIELLKNNFKDAIYTKEPGGTQFGIKARELLLHGKIESKEAELLLFLADRAEHYKEVIEPNLDKTIISDRGFVSGIAYAMAAGFELDFLLNLNRFTLNNNLPDKIVLFNINKEELTKRVQSRGEMDRIESRGFDYLLDIQEKMHIVVDALDIKPLFIDATKSIEDINSQIIEYILL